MGQEVSTHVNSEWYSDGYIKGGMGQEVSTHVKSEWYWDG
jgi:hypothetical protein